MRTSRPWLANKNARIVWAMLAGNVSYEPERAEPHLRCASYLRKRRFASRTDRRARQAVQNTRLKASERWWPTCRLIEPQSLLRRPLIVLLLVILRLIMADDATCRRSEETVTGSESKTPMIRAQRTRNARKGAPWLEAVVVDMPHDCWRNPRRY